MQESYKNLVNIHVPTSLSYYQVGKTIVWTFHSVEEFEKNHKNSVLTSPAVEEENNGGAQEGKEEMEEQVNN